MTEMKVEDKMVAQKTRVYRKKKKKVLRLFIFLCTLYYIFIKHTKEKTPSRDKSDLRLLKTQEENLDQKSMNY